VTPSLSLGAAANYALLAEGGGNTTVQITNVTTNVTGSGPSQGNNQNGNIGVGGTAKVNVGGPSNLNGSIDVAAANTGQTSTAGNSITGGVNFSVPAVTSALSTVNALNTTLGALPGTSTPISGNTTINASSGTFSASGAGYTNARVFTVSSFQLNNGQTLTINGDANNDTVVINFPASLGNINFNGAVVLNGISPDNVIFNFVGGNSSTLTGGATLQLNTNNGLVQGIFLNPNGKIGVSGNTNIYGRIFGGDSQDFQFNGPSNLTAPLGTVTPTLTTTPNPTAVPLNSAAPPVLKDSATIAGGNSPTGTITFTLIGPGGTTVDTESVAVSGNGTYTTPLGFTLPGTGSVIGTYQWNASYSGDGLNNPVSDNNSTTEQVTVTAANPTLTTTPNTTAITLGATTPPVLTDTAILTGGFRPGGTITFTLVHNGTTVDTETATVTGNGSFTTPTGFTLPTTGNVTGTYQWNATYSGDPNNNTASDIGDATEQVTVTAASPTLTTTPNPGTATLGTTLQDVATLAGGFAATGSITFRLYAPGVDPTVGPAAYTETVPGVNGNGTYRTTVGFATTATGTWHWVATYSGDPNNNSIVSAPLAEPVTIPAQADLALAKTVSNSTPNVGQNVTFTVTLSNIGPDTATGVTVNDLLPSGLTFVSAVPSEGTYSSTTGLWTVGPVTTATPQTLTITATVVSPTAETNTATISASDQLDPNGANNSAAATVTPQQADLALAKTVNNPTPNVGNTVNYTVTLTDLGPNTATNVSVTDLLPSGLTFVSATPSEGTYVPGTGIWTVGTVTTATPQTLTITATVTSPSASTNSASITHSDQFDPDTSNNTASTTVTPQQADVFVAKTVSNPTPNVGDTITFTITVGNNGPNAATNVSVLDALPAEVSFVSDTPSQGSYSSATGLWTVGTVAPGVTETLTITVTVVSTVSQPNTASVDHSDQFDPNTANNTATASINPVAADLQMAKTVDNPTPNVGQNVTFTVSLINNGPSTATNVTATDLLPSGLTFVSDTLTQGMYNSATGLWTVGTVAVGTQTLTITATVTGTGAATNTATITHSDQFDPNTANNTASTTVTPQQADLALAKTVSNPAPNVGQNVTYTVTLTDRGPDAATNVSVTDLLPSGLTFVSATPSEGTYVPGTGIWTVGTVTTATPQTLTITATVTSPSASTNSASITHSDQFDPDPTNNTASSTITPQQADLALAKTVSNSTPNVGNTITYTVTLTDLGPNTATNVTVNDSLPAGLTLVSATPSQGTYAGGVWTVGTVIPSVAPTLTITATVTSPNASTNTASISHSDQFDPVLSNNTASTTVTPQQADLALAKTVSNPTPQVGQNVTFTVTLSNTGPNTATNVSVTDLLPSGLGFVSATPSEGIYSSATGLWTVPTVTTTTPETLTITATVVSPSAETNTSTITHSDQFDPVLTNNTASATVTPQVSDLALAKTVSNPTPNVGQNVTFTITLSNTGPSTATNVQVSDLLPSGLTFVSDTLTQGTYNSATGLWTVGTVAVGTQTLTITATVTTPGAETNTATIDHSDQFDPNPNNNTASSTVTPQQADLALAKTVSNSAPNVGDTITYTVTLSNTGPSTATNVTVNDLLPGGLTFVSATPSEGTYVPGTGLWTVGTVTAATPETLTIQAIVVSPSFSTNTASITHSDQFDPDPTNNTASTTVTPQQADLFVGKTVSNPTPNVGDTITYTVTVGNNGPATATNVTLRDILPTEVTYQSSSATEGSYNPATNIWTVGTVAANAPQTLTITALVTSPNPGTNTASISHSDQFDPDTANNNDTASITPQQSDLELAKTVSDSTPNVGQNVTFTVTLTNNGPSTATNVSVTDLLPSGLTFVSAAPSEGTYVPGTGLWTVGTVTMATPQTLTIIATVVSSNPATNTATISTSDQFDPDTGNDTASTTVTPQQADLVVGKTVDNPTPNVGDTVTFTIALGNIGPDSATNVTVNDALPAGLTLLSATPSEGTYAGGVWTVGTVTTSAVQTLILTARVTSPGAETNTATIGRSDQFDPDTANNTAGATVTPQQADLALAKTVNDPTPNVGDTVTFTVTLTDLGPDAATNVTVNDHLPGGLTLLSATPSQGTYTGGVWTVGTVTTAVAPTLTLAARVDSPGSATNTATIGRSDQFDPNGNNNTASATVTPQQADLALAKTVNNPTPNVGDTVTFTVTLTDLGPNTATNVSVTDLLPSGLTFVSDTLTQGTYDSATGLWTVGTVTTTTPQTLTITATVVSPSTAINTATITSSDQFDPVPSNNTASTTVTPQQADLFVAKTVSDPTPNVGDTITFTVKVGNNGPNAATNVTLLDALPAEVQYQSSSATAGSYNPTTHTWTVGTVGAGVTETLTITVTVISPVTEPNTASISHSDQFDPNPNNNTDTASINPLQSDLQLAKTVNDPAPNVGQNVTFTVTLINTGPSTATNVQVSDPLPSGLTFVSDTLTQGTYNSATGLWTVGTVDVGTQTLTITATVESPGAETNTATISHSDQDDPNPNNNTASVTVTPQEADLVMAKTVSDQTPNVGQDVTFTITLSNTGPDTATNVSVLDLLPGGLTFVSDTLTQGTYDSATGLWTVGTVTTTTPQTLTILATVTSPGTAINTATIDHSDQFDPNGANNSAAATVTPQQADLALTKTVNDPTPNVGNTVTFTITLTDRGPDPATNVTVNDSLPAGLTLVSATPSQGTYTGGVWTVGTVTPAAAPTLTITATVTSPGAQTNTATITHSDQDDPNPTNNTASTTVTPQQADVFVGKTVSNPTPNVGDTISYTVTVGNNGPNTATGVTIQDILPAQVSYQSSSATEGSYNPATNTWTVGSVAVGTLQTLTILVRVDAANPQPNTASISHSDQFDPDTSNNSVTASITPQQADLEMAKSVSDPTPNVGQNVTFTVTLINNGPDTATGVTVTDLLPSGLTFVSDTLTQGMYNSATGLWTVGTVAVGTQTLTILATVTGAGAATNTATITSSDQSDPDPGNNTASTTVTPQQANLVVGKTVSNPTPNVGDTVTFTVTLANTGPDDATNVTLSDLLPGGLSFVSANPSQGTFNSTSGLWTVGTVTPSVAQTLTITATVVSPSAETNTATITHTDQFDPNPDTSANVTVTPQQADLALTKTVNDPTPNKGDTVTFTITLTNNGPDPADHARISDLLPSGLTFVSATPSLGSYNPATGIWSFGTLTRSVSATLTVTATVVSPGPETNTVTVAHSDQFDPDLSNNTASATVTPRIADLAITKTVNNSTPSLGETVTFTVTLTNHGPSDATDVIVTDAVPAGLSFVGATPSQGSFVSGVWTVGTVASGSTAVLVIAATVVSPGTETNIATVTHTDQFDTGNNTASVTVTSAAPNSSVAGSVYFDSNNNGVRDPGEIGIPGITVTLTGSDPVFATVVTNANGYYLFRNLFPGTYTLTENPPPGTIDGRDHVGSLGGVLAPSSITNIPVGANQAGVSYDFSVLGLTDPSKYWLLSSSNLSALFGPPGSGITDVNPGPAQPSRVIIPEPVLVVFPSPLGTAVAEFFPGATSPSLILVPFPGYFGPLSTAVGDVMGAGHPDIVVATASGTNAVEVYDGVTGALVDAFFAFPGAPVGASVGVGDVTGSGQMDIVVGTATGASFVRVFDPRTGQVVSSFLALPGFTGGIQIAVGDEEGTGIADIAVAPNGMGFVAVFDESGALIRFILPFGPSYTGALSIAFGSATAGPAPLFIGTATGGAQVASFVAGMSEWSFVAFPNFTGGVQVAAGDVGGTGQSQVVMWAAGTDLVGIAQNGAAIDAFLALPLPAADLTASLLWLARSHGF
jgi:uncharacterized repeat protein (TIGR01451 family)